MSVNYAAATEIPSRVPGVTAWISDLSISPLGVTFTVIAKLTERGTRYYPTVVMSLDGGAEFEVGGSTSATNKMSATQFMHLRDVTGVVERIDLSVYESTDTAPGATRTLVFQTSIGEQ